MNVSPNVSQVSPQVLQVSSKVSQVSPKVSQVSPKVSPQVLQVSPILHMTVAEHTTLNVEDKITAQTWDVGSCTRFVSPYVNK